MIHTPPETEAGDPAEGDPLWDCVISCALTNETGEWRRLQGITIGSGVFYNFSLGFSDTRGFLRRLAVAIFNGTQLGNKDNRGTDAICALSFSGGAVINDILRVNRGWYPLDTEAGFEEKVRANPQGGARSLANFEEFEEWVPPEPLDVSDEEEELDYPEPTITPQDEAP